MNRISTVPVGQHERLTIWHDDLRTLQILEALNALDSLDALDTVAKALDGLNARQVLELERQAGAILHAIGGQGQIVLKVPIAIGVRAGDHVACLAGPVQHAQQVGAVNSANRIGSAAAANCHGNIGCARWRAILLQRSFKRVEPTLVSLYTVNKSYLLRRRLDFLAWNDVNQKVKLVVLGNGESDVVSLDDNFKMFQKPLK